MLVSHLQGKCWTAIERVSQRNHWLTQCINLACIVMDFNTPPDSAPEQVAAALREEMGDAHESATLTCTLANDKRVVYSWNAGELLAANLLPSPASAARLKHIWHLHCKSLQFWP